MNKKIRVNGQLPGEKEVILGYFNNHKETTACIREYTKVFKNKIEFRVRWVTMITTEKAKALSNLLEQLGSPLPTLIKSLIN